MKYTVNVANIGRIGEYDNLIRARQAATSTIYNSARADNYYHIEDENGELVAEGKHHAVARDQEKD